MTPLRHDTARSRPVALPNYAYGFASWHERVTGRPLTPPHRDIIARLERQRHAATGCGHLSPRHTPIDAPIGMRVIIEDESPAASGIADLLTLYVQWLASRILPHRHPLICDITAAAARRLLLPASPLKNFKDLKSLKDLNTPPPHAPANKNSALCPSNFALTTASSRRPARLRGQSCDIALMLNCHAYPRKGPFASRGHGFYLYGVDNFNDLLRTLLPMLPPHPESILIIHGCPNRRVTGFQSLRLKARAAKTIYTLLTPKAIILPAPLPAPIIKRLIRPIGPIPLKNLKDLTLLKDLKALILEPPRAKVA